MPARLPDDIERKRGFSFSIEESWKQRFIIACHEKSKAEGRPIVASQILARFVRKTTLQYERDIQKRKRLAKAA